MTTDRFLLQMAGRPGAGKSTLAVAIARHIDAVVLDKDVIKASLLDAGIQEGQAAPAAYEVMFAQAGDLLVQGFSVILDSPSFWPSIPTTGAKLADKHGVRYTWIECVCSDAIEHARRLRERRARSSQQTSPSNSPRGSIVPDGIPTLTVETAGGIEESTRKALAYLDLATEEQP